MMFDKEEKIRSFINRQYVKLKRVAGVGSLLLLALNFAFTLYPYVSHRMIFSNIYSSIFLLFIMILLVMWLLAHVYVVVMGMYRTEAKADYIYNPYSTFAFTPKDEVFLRYFYLPTLLGVYDSIKDEKVKKELKDCIDRVRFWVEKGYVPRKDFPKDLKNWFITDENKRL